MVRVAWAAIIDTSGCQMADNSSPSTLNYLNTRDRDYQFELTRAGRSTLFYENAWYRPSTVLRDDMSHTSMK